MTEIKDPAAATKALTFFKVMAFIVGVGLLAVGIFPFVTSTGQTNLGVAPNVGGLLCYVPCCIGLIFSVVAAIVEKQSRFLRFHAFQSLLFHAAAIRATEGLRLSVVCGRDPALGAAVERAEVVFIAVGTPPGEDGSADLRLWARIRARVGDAEPIVFTELGWTPVQTLLGRHQTDPVDAQQRLAVAHLRDGGVGQVRGRQVVASDEQVPGGGSGGVVHGPGTYLNPDSDSILGYDAHMLSPDPETDP